MKISILWALAASLFAISLTACNEDKLSPESIFRDDTTPATPFDIWLERHFVQPYNIEVKYRFIDAESDMYYQLVPADYQQSIRLAHLVKFLCLEVYDTITGSRAFIQDYFPKYLFFVGSPAYNNNGSITLGTAEGGTQINLLNVNMFDQSNMSLLNEYYFKTIHHEFTHILNQTKPYTTDYNQIVGTATGIAYVGSQCFSEYPKDELAWVDGFISPYSATSADEDFAEMVSIYVTNSAATWNSILQKAGSTGRAMIESKFEIVQQYMEKDWGIDLDEVRAEVQRRQAMVPALDLDTLND